MNRFKGFTLVELMVVLAILAIVAFIAVPNFTTLVRNNRVEAQAEELNALLQFARSEAAIRKIDTFVDFDSAAGEIMVREIGRGTDPNVVLRTSTFDPTAITLDVSASSVGYRPNGSTTAPGFRALICGGSDTTNGRLLTIVGSGTTILHHKGKDADGDDLESCSL